MRRLVGLVVFIIAFLFSATPAKAACSGSGSICFSNQECCSSICAWQASQGEFRCQGGGSGQTCVVSASPNPCNAGGGASCATTVHWSFAAATNDKTRLSVGVNGGASQQIAGGTTNDALGTYTYSGMACANSYYFRVESQCGDCTNWREQCSTGATATNCSVNPPTCTSFTGTNLVQANYNTTYSVTGSTGSTGIYSSPASSQNWTTRNTCSGTNCSATFSFPGSPPGNNYSDPYYVVSNVVNGSLATTGNPWCGTFGVEGSTCGPYGGVTYYQSAACRILVNPCKVNNFSVTPGSGSCTINNISWTNLTSNATGVIIQRMGGGILYNGPITSYTNSGLTPGTTYQYNVGCNWGGGYVGWQSCTPTCTPSASWGTPWDTGTCSPGNCHDSRNVTCNATCGGLCDGVYSNGQSKFYDYGGAACNVTASWANTGSCGQYSACKQSEICNATCGGTCSGGYTNGQIRSVNNCGCTCSGVSFSPGSLNFPANESRAAQATANGITGGGSVANWTITPPAFVTVTTPPSFTVTGIPSNPNSGNISVTATLSPIANTCSGTLPVTTTAVSYFQTSGGDVGSRGNITESYLPAGRYIASEIIAANSISPLAQASSKSWVLNGYTINNSLTAGVDYASLLRNVAKNAGTSNNFDSICTSQKTDSTTLPGYTIYCYVPSQFNASFVAAASSGTNILYPVPGWGSPNPITTATTVNSKLTVFVNGNLSVNANVTVGINGGAVFVTNGNVTVDPAVGRLDGVYLFSGSFSDVGSNQLIGNGSLLGTGLINFSRTYPFTAGPAESWTYEPKYLDLFKKILSTASYTWKELPPQ